MKNNKIFLILLCLLFSAGCDPIDPEGDGWRVSRRYTVHFVKFADESYKDYVISKSPIPTYPKRNDDGPYFISDVEKAKKEQSYDICELASNPVLIELHNGYYMYYPYTKLGCSTAVRNVKWSEVCNVDLDTVGILSDQAYAEVWHVLLPELKKRTLKSHEKMTIADIEKAINKIIDTNKIEKYAYGTRCPQSDWYDY